MLEQFANFRHELVDGLYQQGPLALGKLAELVFGEWAAAHFPRALAVLDDQSRFDFFFQRKACQFVGVDRAFEIREGLAYQQGLLLPVVAQKFACSQTAQKLKRSIRIHV
ncbi:hypothetical protein D9M71_527040 [compost metagenome]